MSVALSNMQGLESVGQQIDVFLLTFFGVVVNHQALSKEV